MKVRIEHAVISFCSDLTDPNSSSQPVALIGLGHTQEFSVFFLGVLSLNPDDERLVTDQLSQRVLADLPKFLESQIFKEGLTKVGPNGLIRWLHNNLRNSLHVSNIEQCTLDFGVSPHELPTYFFELFDKKVIREIKRLQGSATSLPNIRFEPLTTNVGPALAEV